MEAMEQSSTQTSLFWESAIMTMPNAAPLRKAALLLLLLASCLSSSLSSITINSQGFMFLEEGESKRALINSWIFSPSMGFSWYLRMLLRLNKRFSMINLPFHKQLGLSRFSFPFSSVLIEQFLYKLI
jgi:hypothetical protein